MASVQQHLLRMQQRMKVQADKRRSERSFAVSDEVFLRLQPYIQTSIARRKNHKLSFKFFGPFKVLERVGQVAYRLALPESSRVHPVFHVSQLKPCIKPGQQVSTHLPPPDAAFHFPFRVLQSRVRHNGRRTIAQVLVQWSGMPEEAATWEDRETVKQLFPYAPAWGQAGLQEGGIVNDRGPPGEDTGPQEAADKADMGATRPQRNKRRPGWQASGEWAM